MSDLYFQATLKFRDDENLSDTFDNTVLANVNTLEMTNLAENELQLIGEGLSHNLMFYENLIEVFNDTDGVEFKARLFDSASGGHAAWCKPEEEPLDIEGRIVCIIGVDEEEGIHEALESGGAVVHEELRTDTSILIYGDEVAVGELLKQISGQVSVLQFDDFWDEFDYLAFG